MQFQQVRPPFGSELPGVIQPHDAGSAVILREDLDREGIDVYEPITAWVRLATGELVKSTPTQVLTRD
jgi:hypothetical protein